MHLAFMTRGEINAINKFIKELSTRYLDFEIYNPKSKAMEQKIIQMRVCPIQLWDISFPKQHWNAVAKTVLGGSNTGNSNRTRASPNSKKRITII